MRCTCFDSQRKLDSFCHIGRIYMPYGAVGMCPCIYAHSLWVLWVWRDCSFQKQWLSIRTVFMKSRKTGRAERHRSGSSVDRDIWTWASWGKTFASTSVNLTRWNGRFQLRSCSVPHTAIRTLLWCRFRGRYMHLARFTSSACGCVLVNKILLRTFSLAVWSHGIKLISHINNICKIWIMTKSWII